MSDKKLFYDDPSLDRARARVVETGDADDRTWLRLDATIFYPEGGGQPSDRGTIGGVPILDVRSRRDQVIHLLEGTLDCEPGDEVELILDAARRFDHRQQHTAQHLVSAILDDRHGLPTTAFHLGAGHTAIEFPGAPPVADMLAAWEAEINAEIRRDHAVRTRWVSPEDLAGLPVRTRGLPDGHTGKVRLVEIEGIDLNTCGGTHVDRLAEIQIVHLVGAEAARGAGTRLRFLAGGRVFADLARHEAIAAALNARIGTAPEEFAAVIDGWQAERKRLERRVRDLEVERASLLAAEIASGPGPRFVRHLPGAGPEALRALAMAVLERRPEGIVILTGESGDPPEACFLVQAGPASPEDVLSIGTQVRDAMGAKGGGRGKAFQGKGGVLVAFDASVGS